MTTHTYRPLKKMDKEAFCRDILQPQLFDLDVTDADQYAELIDSEVKRVLDVHTLLFTSRRCWSQHDSCCLSDEASNFINDESVATAGPAWRLTSWLICRLVQRHAVVFGNHVTTDHVDEVSGDFSATWRTDPELLHGKQKAVYGDDECSKLVLTFSQYFVDKVNHIRDNTAEEALRSSARRDRTSDHNFTAPTSVYRRSLSAVDFDTMQVGSRHHSTCCHVHWWSPAAKSSLQLANHSHYTTSGHRFCHCWRKLCSTSPCC